MLLYLYLNLFASIICICFCIGFKLKVGMDKTVTGVVAGSVGCAFVASLSALSMNSGSGSSSASATSLAFVTRNVPGHFFFLSFSLQCFIFV